MSDRGDETNGSELSRRQAVTRLGLGALGVAGAGYGLGRAVDGGPAPATAEPAGGEPGGENPGGRRVADPSAYGLPVVSRVAADPAEMPGPVTRRRSRTVETTLTVREAVTEVEPGVNFAYMTFDGQVPGPMIRVRQGDEVRLRMENPSSNSRLHNVDLHAVYGPGGGAEATKVGPDQANEFVFQARYPGAFVYHCAIPTLDMHISCGMFGMILVEPREGLPEVDREIYVGQHELYTDALHGEEGNHHFSLDRMKREDPTYVLMNGEKYGLTPDRRGAAEARVGETARVFFANGGPNLTSSFHPIGNVWTKLWREGAVMSEPECYVQTASVPPGSTLVGELDFEVPGPVKLVDHALTRVARKGMLGVIDVKGPERPEIFRDPAGAGPMSG